MTLGDATIISVCSYRNRLVEVRQWNLADVPTLTVQYIYDAFDQRVGKRVDENADGDWDRYEAFVWADGQTVLRLTDSDGEASNESFRVASRYLYGDAVDQVLADEQYADNGPLVSSTTASTAGGLTLWPLGDHLGSIRDVVDNNGVIRQHVVYDSFGNRLSEVNYDAGGVQIDSSHADAIDLLFGYTGRDWDEDVGLQYNRARWYDPATGRWISQDPIGFNAGDANLYRYVGNQATTHVDPNGLAETWPDWFWEWFGYDDAYYAEQSRINGIVSNEVSQLDALANGDPLTLARMSAAASFGEDAISRRLTQALIEKAIARRQAQGDCGYAAQEWVLERGLEESRRIAGTGLNIGTEGRRAAGHGSKEGPLVAAVVIPILRPDGGVPRVGQARPGTTEVPVDELTHTHPVPRPGKSIAETAEKLRGGYDLAQPVPVFRMKDGKKILAGGNHRLAAMKGLGEKTIPCRVVDWDAQPERIKEIYRKSFPDVFGGY